MLSKTRLVCPHIDRTMAFACDSNYYCNVYNSEFESMATFCKHCPIYNDMIEHGLNDLIAAINLENKAVL